MTRAQNFRAGAHKPVQVCYNRGKRKKRAGGSLARMPMLPASVGGFGVAYRRGAAGISVFVTYFGYILVVFLFFVGWVISGDVIGGFLGMLW